VSQRDRHFEELTDMNALAAWHDGGPGPWILFFPLLWGAAVVTVVTVLRRTAWRGRRGPWNLRGPAARGFRPGAAPGAPGGETSAVVLLARRFAAGEIDEDEYFRRRSVLEQDFGASADV
jgi:putative membrane protein